MKESDMFEFVKMKKEHLEQVENISKEQFENTTWSKSQFEKEIDNSYVCMLENNVVGFLCLQVAGNEITILNLAVKKEFLRRHIATQFLTLTKQLAKEKNISDIFLEVEQNNNPAISFYSKNGFSILRTRKNYYKDGTSCFEMKLGLK